MYHPHTLRIYMLQKEKSYRSSLNYLMSVVAEIITEKETIEYFYVAFLMAWGDIQKKKRKTE